mgnify:CR=1 FL=1
MRKVVILAFVALGVLGVGAVATADDDDGSSQNGARLNGYQEVSSVSTTGFGSFHIKFNKDMTADYVLSGAYQLEIACRLYPAKVSLEALYDPKSERVRG